MSGAAFEPKLVAFLCTWCSYAGADKAGGAQLTVPANVRVVRVPCSGRVEPEFVLEAFRKGADGVLVLACHPGDCHYKEGNYRGAQRAALLQDLLAQVGVARERLRFDYVSASEGERFVSLVTAVEAAVRRLGPLTVPIREDNPA